MGYSREIAPKYANSTIQDIEVTIKPREKQRISLGRKIINEIIHLPQTIYNTGVKTYNTARLGLQGEFVGPISRVVSTDHWMDEFPTFIENYHFVTHPAL